MEIMNNMSDMAESLTGVLPVILLHLRPWINLYEYSEIISKANDMLKVTTLLDILLKYERDHLVIKFCDTLESARHTRWIYLRDYCERFDA